jgi:hypothetical protein
MFFRHGPGYLIATGVAWLCYGAYLIVSSWAEWVQEPRALGTIVWPALGLAALIGGLGLVAARPFSRGLIVFLAGLGLAGTVAFLSTLALPSVASWWLVVVLAVFFLWSVILVVLLWPAQLTARAAAG